MVTSNQLENMLFWHSLSFLHSFLSLWSGHSNIWFHTQQLNPISFHQPLLSRSTSSSLSKSAYSLALPHSPLFTVTRRSFYFFKSNNHLLMTLNIVGFQNTKYTFHSLFLSIFFYNLIIPMHNIYTRYHFLWVQDNSWEFWTIKQADFFYSVDALQQGRGVP